VLLPLYFLHHLPNITVECAGYYGRVWNHNDPTNFGAFCLQGILILVAPILFAATIYMTLGRIVRALDAKHLAPIRVNWLTKIFVLSDLTCFFISMAGVGLQVTTDSKMQRLGVKICLVGLIIQAFVVTWFFIVSIRLHRRLILEPTNIAYSGVVEWRKHFWTLYFVCVATLLRNTVRAVEYGQGFNGTIMHHELIFYLFEATLMGGVAWAYVFVHPARLVRCVRKDVEAKLNGEGGVGTVMGNLDDRR